MRTFLSGLTVITLVAAGFLSSCETTRLERCPADKSFGPANGLCFASPPDLSGDGFTPGDGFKSCSGSTECDSATPICKTNVCKPCIKGIDDSACMTRASSTPRCLDNGQCGGCRPDTQTSDCSSAKPVCGSDNHCRVCQAQSECPSLVCNLDGTCAAPSTVTYVDNKNGACTGSTHSGRMDDPFCDIQPAISAGATQIVRVIGSTSPYGPVTIASGNVTVVGAASGESSKVEGTTSAPAFNITGMTTVVALDALEIYKGGVGQDGVSCMNNPLGPTVTITRSNLHNLDGVAVNATKCTVTLDRDVISGNNSGGISLTGSPFNITNCFFIGNLTKTSTTVFLGPGSTPTPNGGFRHNTVTGNLGPGAGGVSCQNTGTALAIESSILWNNNKVGNSQFVGNCTFNYTDSNEAVSGGTDNTMVAPDFINASGSTAADFHLNGRTTNNTACCIDRIPSSPVNHDFDGNPRPAPSTGKWSKGATEAN